MKIKPVLGCLVALAWVLPVRADTRGEHAGAAEAGGTLWLEGEGDEPWLAPQLSTEVDLVVTGMVARGRVEQIFENPSEEAVEAVYVFPLPDDAAVDGFSLTRGDRRIVGVLRARDEAERRYELGAKAGKAASLVSQERPNVFTTSVTRIGPGELVSVSISYQQEVRYEHGEFSILFPSTLTPRYVPGQDETGSPLFEAAVSGVSGVRAPPSGASAAVPDAARVAPPMLLDGSGPLLDVKVALDAGMPLESVESPSHAIEVERAAPGRVSVRLEEGPVLADRDFRLRWRPKAPAQDAVFTEQFGGQRYALLLLTPPQVDAEPASLLPRETIFVIDTSASMAGDSIRQAVAALRSGLASLAPTDHFNVIDFDSNARQLFDTARPASRDHVARALDWAEALRAEGGSEVVDALRLALAAPVNGGRRQQVVLISDGSVAHEPELFRFIREHRAERRLFTLGVGAAPNAFFLRGAARLGRGASSSVSSLPELSSELEGLWAKLGTPVLRDVAVHGPGTSPDAWPRAASELFRGEPLVLIANLGAGAREAAVSGLLAGKPFTQPVAFDRAARGSGIHRLWARRQIEALMDSAAEGRDEASIRSTLLPLALRHRLMSKYTSLVAVDTEPSREGRAPRASVGLALPAGNEMFGVVPQTGMPGPFCLVSDPTR